MSAKVSPPIVVLIYVRHSKSSDVRVRDRSANKRALGPSLFA